MVFLSRCQFISNNINSTDGNFTSALLHFKNCYEIIIDYSYFISNELNGYDFAYIHDETNDNTTLSLNHCYFDTNFEMGSNIITNDCSFGLQNITTFHLHERMNCGNYTIPQSQTFVQSFEFTSSNKFSLSDTFHPLNLFTTSNKFTASNIFTSSSTFTTSS